MRISLIMIMVLPILAGCAVSQHGDFYPKNTEVPALMERITFTPSNREEVACLADCNAITSYRWKEESVRLGELDVEVNLKAWKYVCFEKAVEETPKPGRGGVRYWQEVDRNTNKCVQNLHDIARLQRRQIVNELIYKENMCIMACTSSAEANLAESK